MYLVEIKICPPETKRRFDKYLFSEVRLFDTFELAVDFGCRYSKDALSKIDYEVNCDDEFNVDLWRKHTGKSFSFQIVPLECQIKGEKLKGISLTPYGEIIGFCGLEDYIKQNFAYLENKGYLKRRFSNGDLIQINLSGGMLIENQYHRMWTNPWGCILEIAKDFPFRLKIIWGDISGYSGTKLQVVYKDFYDPEIQLWDKEIEVESLPDLLSKAAKGAIKLSPDFFDLIRENWITDKKHIIKNCEIIKSELEARKALLLLHGFDLKGKSTKEIKEKLEQLEEDLK